MQEDPKAKEIIAFLEKQPKIQELEQYLKGVRDHYRRNLPFLIQESDILKQLATWLKTKLNTKYSNNLFKFIVRLYQLMGFGYNSDVSEYYRSHERALSKDPKFLSKSYLEGYDTSTHSKENLVDNPLLDFNLLHYSLSVLNTIMVQEDIQKFKPTILVMIGFISIYCYDKNIQIVLRREKFFKTLIQIIKMLDDYNKNEQKIDNDIYILVFEIFAKLTFKCPKNQEYFMKKSGYRIIEPFLRDTNPELSVLRPVLLTLSNCCDQNDYQLIFWSDSFVSRILNKVNVKLRESIEQIKEDQNQAVRSLRCLEVYLIFLNRASTNCEEVVISLLKDRGVIHHLQVLAQTLVMTSPDQPVFQILLRCTASALGTLCSLLEYSFEIHQILTQFNDLFSKILKHFCTIDDSLEKHYPYLACLYRHLLTTIALKETISDEEAQTALKISMLYFVYSKTLNSGLAVLLKYSAQSPKDLANEDDMFILTLKILEGYSYSRKTLQSMYAIMCNLSINPVFLDKASQINVFKYCLLHLQKHWKAFNTSILIFRLLKYTLRNGLMIELFFKSYLELAESIDFNVVTLIMQIFREYPQESNMLIEMLSVLAILIRNNRRFEQSIVSNKEFKAFVNMLASEQNSQISDDLVDVLAHFPLEDLLAP